MQTRFNDETIKKMSEHKKGVKRPNLSGKNHGMYNPKITDEERKNRSRAYSLRSRYNLSFNEYQKMSDIQDNMCAICHHECSKNNFLSVDHDHVTNKVRGLLCASCNLALGNFKDSVELLNNAINYLKQHAQ